MIKLKIKYGNSQTDLRFPCTENEMNAALERIHAEDVTPLELYVSEVVFPEELGCLQDRFVNLDEVNYLGKRMDSFFGDEEYQFYEAMKFEGFDTLPDLINLSFNLNRYPLIQDIGDMGKIGRVQQKNDNGVFEGRLYIPTVHYDRPEIYDGVTLPDEESEPSDFAIRLLVSGTPEHIKGDPVDRAIWLDLPMASDILANYAAAFNEADISDCVYYDFESVIPQITSEMFGSMSDVQTLNKLAAEISIMSEAEQVKFKAVLDAENTASIHDALNVAQNLWRYEFTAELDTADAFFKKYILENTSMEFDSRWLENLFPRNEADKLLGRLGVAVTDYGVISARNGHLFEPVPYDEPEAKELKTQALTDEKLDVIEILDRKALFFNGRLMPEQIPEGLYAYDLRHSDDGSRFCSIEPKGGVNHGGTVLMRDILDFGESGYIPLDEDTEPNFLGETMTVSEFAEEEVQDEAMQMGGI